MQRSSSRLRVATLQNATAAVARLLAQEGPGGARSDASVGGALVATDEWKKYLADNFLVADFMNARDAAAFLNSETGEYRALLTELGLAK